MIIITKFFDKNLKKIKSISLSEIIFEIKKHKEGLNNFKKIYELEGNAILKWYLLWKKVRILVLFQEVNWKYLPFYIVRKETKDWKNITKTSISELSSKLTKSLEEYENWKYKIIEI